MKQENILEGPRDRLLTVPELARILGLSRNRIYQLAQRGDLPRRKIGGAVRFSLGEVEAKLRARKD